MTCPENDTVKAKITGFSKRTGDIAFTMVEHYGTVTFMTSLDVWSGNNKPKKGEIVILSQMSKHDKGWRASKARPFTLADEDNESE